MEFSPFFRRPYYYYGQNKYIHPNYNNMNGKDNKKRENEVQHEEQARSYEADQTRLYAKENSEKPIFEIFGIELYFDDILIIALIFFLYNEGVRDNLLFISLILLLLS